MDKRMLHYTMCGLDNIYLINGFSHVATSRGRRLHIENQEGLHRAIGEMLIVQKSGLHGKELRFLREELGLSQTNLASLLGESEQSVARREKRAKPYKRPTAQERMIRYLYKERVLNVNETLRAYLEALADIDEQEAGELTFKDEAGVWQPTLRKAA